MRHTWPLLFLGVVGSRSSAPALPAQQREHPLSRRRILDGTAEIRARAAVHVQQMKANVGGLPARLDRFLESTMRPKSSEVTADAKDASAAYVYVADATSADPAWDMKLHKGKVRVWRRSVSGSRVDEVRGNGIIDAPPSALLGLLCQNDADVIRSYNPLYDTGHDVCRIDGRTRLSYARVRPIFKFKPRDTLTRVAQWELPLLGPGATALLLRHADHPEAPVYPKYVRAKILRGMHLVQPVRGSPGKANYTFCSQVDAGGVVPPFVMNVLTTQDALQFMDRLEKAAKMRHSKGGKAKAQNAA